MGYIKTTPGIFKIIQIVSSVLCFVFVQCSSLRNDHKGYFFTAVSGISFLVTGMFLMLYLCRKVEDNPKIPWLYIEFVLCSMWTILYPVASILAATFNESVYQQQKILRDAVQSTLEEKVKLGNDLAAILLKPPSNTSTYIAVTFGLTAMFAYAVDAYSKWMGARAGAPAQGSRPKHAGATPSRY